MIATLLRNWRLIAAGAALIGLSAWLGYLWAYERGYAAASAHYAAVLADIRSTAAAAQARAETLHRRWAQDVARLTEEYRHRENELKNLAADAERALSERLRLAAAAARRCDVPADPAAAGGNDGTAAGRARSDRDHRLDELARRAVELGRRYADDALRLRMCQQYVRSVSTADTP